MMQNTFKKCMWIACLCAAISPMAVQADLITDHIFSSTSFWYTPIPSIVPLHPNSAGFVSDFIRQKKTYYGTVGVNTTFKYSSPVYYVDASVRKVKVTQWDCTNRGTTDAGLAAQWAEVPIPSYAKPADASDSEMTIYQPSTDTIWEFWKTRQVNGQWQACWGGRMQKASQSDGVFNTYYGTTATSLPFLGGQITAEELQRGEIKHAIGIALVETEGAKVFSWPAHRSDGLNPNNAANRIPEGMRFRLDPTVNVDALNMNPVGKIIAKAAQKYGFIVWDKAGAVVIRAQNPYSYTVFSKPNPYDALLNGAPNWSILQNFPWERLQFLPMDYGKQK
ncbi:DUF4124 domain-containing protein [Methylotenera sp.]|uniref:DUF4124 domain-containing protein n=1 Tax=Methylotenera sp. TaxID=2051956 RepID=UPI0024872BD4|nr:DUF4124 domain-containing protein [Methylotenera sp.]MDI1298245.1 DUF4124 domain-containing protein [Methylotenera sp.]